MKLFSILALTILLPLHGGSCFSSMKFAQVIPTDSRKNLLNGDDSPMNTFQAFKLSPDQSPIAPPSSIKVIPKTLDLNFQLGDRPDLMPPQGTALINRLNDSKNNALPRYIFFHGPSGCGKSTLIHQLTQSINADPIYIQYDDLKNQCANVASASATEIKDFIAASTIKQAQINARLKQCSRAVIVLNDVDTFFEDQSPHSKDIFDVFFTPQCLAQNILIIGESKTAMPKNPLVENIAVQYPNDDAARKLAHYFFKELKVKHDSFPLNDPTLMQNMADAFSNKPISKLESFAGSCITQSKESREKEATRIKEWWDNIHKLAQPQQPPFEAQ